MSAATDVILVLMGGLAAFLGLEYLTKGTAAKTASTGTTVGNVASAAQDFATATIQGGSTGYQYATSGTPWSGSANDIWSLATETQNTITAVAATWAAPVIYAVDGLASAAVKWL